MSLHGAPSGWKWTKEDFLSRVKKIESGCWEWQQALVRGYGHWSFHGKIRKTHHIALYLFNGTPFDTFQKQKKIQVDHLCRNKCCCNPDHLEIVTARENLKRGFTGSSRNIDATVCVAGHPLDEKNTRIIKSNKTRNYDMRMCKKCDIRRGKIYKAKRRAMAKIEALRTKALGLIP